MAQPLMLTRLLISPMGSKQEGFRTLIWDTVHLFGMAFPILGDKDVRTFNERIIELDLKSTQYKTLGRSERTRQRKLWLYKFLYWAVTFLY